MKKTINNSEIMGIKAIYGNDTEAQDAVLVHDTTDEFHNGDCIYFGYTVADIENADDLAAMFEETGYSAFDRVDGIYTVEV